MPLSDGIPSSPPGPATSLEQSLKYYKAQYETLESELADFQASSKELEAELEKDIDASEKRERSLKDKANNLQYEVDEWKAKYKQAKSEASSAQNALQKEITELRDSNRTLQLRLRDIEVANDDYEKQQRNTESSLEDMESKYNQTIERSVMLEEEMRTGEAERESLRIDAQRLKDELSDLKIETDIIREKLRKAESTSSSTLTITPVPVSASPRSELSPTTTDASFDTPPAKTSSSGVSDTPTPPSPPISDKSGPVNTPKPFATPILPKTRTSINAIPTPRQPTYSSRAPTSHTRGPSIPAISKTAPPGSRPSLGGLGLPRRGALPQSSSIMHLRSLRSKMQNLEERVHSARSKLPGPVNTPPRASPRSGSALGNHAIPTSVTVRSKRKTGSTIGSLPDSDGPTNTPGIPRTKPSRTSLTNQFQRPASPTKGEMNAPPRPSSRSSYMTHSRPGSRASLSGFRAPPHSTPNASTDRVRPKSSMSNYGGDGAMDDDESIIEGSILEDDEPLEDGSGNGSGNGDFITPTPRRTTLTSRSRTSDIGIGGAGGSAIPTPKARKRESMSKIPALGLARRQSQQGFNAIVSGNGSVNGSVNGNDGMMRPPSRSVTSRLSNVRRESKGGEGAFDVSETF